MNLQSSTKARTLAALRPVLRAARVLPQRSFSATDWREDPAAILAGIRSQFGPVALIVRSSAVAEDQSSGSLAGHFRSVSDVNGKAELRDAIDAVIASFGAVALRADEVLVQPLLADIRIAGVAFSQDPSTGSLYRVINYTLQGDASAVTGGGAAPLRTFVAARTKSPLPPPMARIVSLIEELEAHFPGCALDVEFAVDRSDDLYLFQVRPLLMDSRAPNGSDHDASLRRISNKVASQQRPHPCLYGRSTVFGVMPDWNPAELIGIRPKPLALSLFRRLVTDGAWSVSRHRYGYRDMRGLPLLVDLGGQPYIDLRISFNSFLPADIEPALGERLVDHYLERLSARPALHDKVEFEIVLSCCALDMEHRLAVLADAGIERQHRDNLASSLRRLTNRLVDPARGIWREDRDRLALLDRRRERVLAGGLPPLSQLHLLLDDCVRYGTQPFAGLARAGFVAVQMLRSMVSVGVISLGDEACFMRGLDTVSRRLPRELCALDRETFLRRYGHLRPGTFDITNPRYDETPDEYFDWDHAAPPAESDPTSFSVTAAQRREIDARLRCHRLDTTPDDLLFFIRSAIEWREQAKFTFTRSLSDALAKLKEYGRSYGFTTDELAFVSIDSLRPLLTGTQSPAAVLEQAIAAGRAAYRETCSLWLPPLVTAPGDAYSFTLPMSEPNFITQRKVIGPVVRPQERRRLTGGIVFLERADPGYDWLFAQRIGGLVTAYGGVNSHMAIRVGELGLPAVIGAGESLFNQWGGARRIALDCAARRVEMLP